MYCAECGQKIPSDSRFCFNCGHPTAKDSALQQVVAVEEPLRPASPSGQPGLAESLGLSAITTPTWVRSVTRRRVSVPAWLRRAVIEGWGKSAIGAVGAWVGVFLLGLVAVVLYRVAAGEDWANLEPEMPITGLAGIVGSGFSRLPVSFQGFLDLVFVQAEGFGTAIASPGILFFLIALFIALGGRYAARSTNPTDPREAVLQATKVGVVFGAVSLVASYVFAVAEPITPGSRGTTLGVEHAGALWWGLFYGVLFATLGGLWSLRRTGMPNIASTLPAKYRGWVHAGSGALRAIRYGLILGVVAVVVFVAVLVLVNFGEPGSDLRTAGDIIGVAIAILVALPDLVLLLLLGSHGGSLEFTSFISGEFAGPFSYNYLNFPTDDPALGLAEIAPWYLFALLIIPLLAVMAGGYQTARLTGCQTREEARRVGVRMAIPYAVILWLLAVIERFHIEGNFTWDFDFINQITIQFSLLGVLVLGLLWGAAGGALGALRFPKVIVAQPTQPTQPRPSQQAQASQPTHSSVICADCGTENPPENRFCKTCGNQSAAQPPSDTPRPSTPADEPSAQASYPDQSVSPSELICQNCGQTNPADNAFCNSCGKPLG